MRNLEKMVNFRKFIVCSFMLLKLVVFKPISIILIIDRNEKFTISEFQYEHGLEVSIISHLCFHRMIQYDLSLKSR